MYMVFYVILFDVYIWYYFKIKGVQVYNLVSI